MSESSTQLTPFGIESLVRTLPPNSLSIFFRNNHYSTLFNHEGSLYLLVTDEGYRDIPNVVWERLDTCEGSGDLVNENFVQAPPPRPSFPTFPAEDQGRRQAGASSGGGEEDDDLALSEALKASMLQRQVEEIAKFERGGGGGPSAQAAADGAPPPRFYGGTVVELPTAAVGVPFSKEEQDPRDRRRRDEQMRADARMALALQREMEGERDGARRAAIDAETRERRATSERSSRVNTKALPNKQDSCSIC